MNYAQYIGARGNGKPYLVNSNGDTGDIIGAIMDADKQAARYTANLAPVLRGTDTYHTCANLWKFWKEHVRYQEDPEGHQYIKSPRELFHSGFGDCKSYSIAVASCLKNLGIPYVYRFTSETPGKEYHHVYIVAKTPQGPVIIDCVLDKFNYQNPFVMNKDLAPATSKIGALGTIPFGSKTKVFKVRVAGIGANGDTEPVTVVAPEPGFWANEADDIKKNFRSLCIRNSNSLSTGIGFAWPGKPLIRKKLQNSVIDEYKNLLQGASSMAYKFWQGNAPLPDSLLEKKQFGEKMYNRLKEIGCRDGDLLVLCSLSVFNTYGVSLDYMNYRAQNTLKYGQPWTPKYGVPYWNVRTGVLVANGASLETSVKIGLCLPVGGGFSRPWGQPYWAAGGWVMLNGAPESQLEFFIANNPRPQGTQTNISDEFRYQCIALYDQWRENNIPALPLPDYMKGGIRAKIGEPITLSAAAIVSIITVVLSAIAAIATMVTQILKNQNPISPTANVIPEYIKDGLDNPAWTTVSGKYMFYNPTTGTYTLCDTATGQNCVAANPNDPNNAPAYGNFGEQSKSKWLFIAGGVLLLLGLLWKGGSKANS